MRYCSFIILLAISFLQIGCEKDAVVQPKDYPFVVIDKLDVMPNKYVAFHANIAYKDSLEIIDHGFVIVDVWHHNDPSKFHYVSLGILAKNLTGFNDTIYSGLEGGMKYYLRAYTKNARYTVYSNEVFFANK
ncbi:MAG TPA: hypothetical protein VMW01_15495 [Williamwhitmania sp.]|nr:hypothetical protein [Williamwhitmania sp.]